MAEAAAIENIAVYARIRSSSQPAEASSDVSVVDGQPDKVRAKDLQFNLDHAFGSDAKQADVYNLIGAPLVQRIIDGYNACIIAYGQTGSGKTYTMLRARSLTGRVARRLTWASSHAHACSSSRCCPRATR